MKGTRIIVSSPPRGVFEDVIVVGTPKPGTVMEIVPAVEPVGGVFRYAVYGTQAASGGLYVSADGDRKCIAVLLEKDDEGQTYNDAYVTLQRGRIYFPIAGEQLNMLFANLSGTDSTAIGDEFMVDDGTGKLIDADNDAEAHPFTCLETGTAMSADEWRWCRFNGEGGA